MSKYFKQATIDRFYQQVAKRPTSLQLFNVSPNVEHNRQLLLPYIPSIFNALRLKYYDEYAVDKLKHPTSSIIDDVEAYITNLITESDPQQWNFWCDFTLDINTNRTHKLFIKHTPQGYSTFDPIDDLQTAINQLDRQLDWFTNDDARFSDMHNFIRRCLGDQLVLYRDYLQQVATDSNNLNNVSQLCCWSAADLPRLQHFLQQPVDGDPETIQIVHLSAVQDFIQKTYVEFVNLITDVYNIIEHLKRDLFFNKLDSN